MCEPKTIDANELIELGMDNSGYSPHLLSHADQENLNQMSDLLLAPEIEQYLNELDKQDDPAEPVSPFYGRTTPQMYGDDDGAPSVHPTNPALEEDHYPDFKQLGVLSEAIPSSVWSFGEHKPELPFITDSDVKSSDVNEKLRRTIQERRRKCGKGAINIEEDSTDHKEVLTPKEKERLQRRRESNRRAAAKSRIKKREEQMKFNEMMNQLKNENKQLREENTKIKQIVAEHLVTCSYPGSLSSLFQREPGSKC